MLDTTFVNFPNFTSCYLKWMKNDVQYVFRGLSEAGGEEINTMGNLNLFGCSRQTHKVHINLVSVYVYI